MKSFSEQRREAIEKLMEQNILRDPTIIKAMLTVPREEFLPPESRTQAYLDTPIPIGFGQTTSALHMTALFCEYGGMKLGQRVLEVGGGCGYMSCVYAEVVAPNDQSKEQSGHVWSAEILPELAEFGRKNIERLGYSDRVTFMETDASEGLSEDGSFNLIIATSAAPEIPSKLVDQLDLGGILLIPIGTASFYQELVRVRRDKAGKIHNDNLGGVAFVPMRGKRGWH
ncbi:MAG TPA: protein-L-isoaspartate O-methyltransferase [Candidatus Bathyarchaeia archaeon]|nr:protein-L-isoaspartate O-methyltransferase [Candidatus Bathyarchaeia archaeon]